MSRKIKRTPTSALSIKVAFEEFVVAQTAKGFAVSTIQNYHSHFHSISKHSDIETPFCELGQTDISVMNTAKCCHPKPSALPFSATTEAGV